MHGIFSSILFPISLFFFSCDDKKNGSSDSQPKETKVSSVDVYDCLENFPIFNSKLGVIKDSDKKKLRRCLESRAKDLEPFFTSPPPPNFDE
ncbi:MAG: hypothetical protein LBD32_01325, partial [Cytophagales bacterium]|nr:hypothetical protein [Cytophagales bacterium]